MVNLIQELAVPFLEEVMEYFNQVVVESLLDSLHQVEAVRFHPLEVEEH